MDKVVWIQATTQLNKAYPTDAGFDLVAAQTVSFMPNETKLVPVATRVCIPNGYWGLIVPRSSWRKRGLVIQAVIDANYVGPLDVVTTWVAPQESEPLVIEEGVRFAQLVIIPLPYVIACISDVLPERGRGCRGLGSSGS